MIKHGERNPESGENNPAKSLASIFKAVIVSHIFLITAFTVLALVYTYTQMPESMLEPAIKVLTAIALLLSGFMASRSISSLGWLHGAAAGLICTLIRVILGLIVFKSYVPSYGVGKMLFAGILCAAIGGILGVNIRPVLNKNTKKKRK